MPLGRDGRFSVTVDGAPSGLYRVLVKRGDTIVRSSSYRDIRLRNAAVGGGRTAAPNRQPTGTTSDKVAPQ